MKVKQRFAAISWSITFFMAIPLLYATDYYVAKNGSDNNPGTLSSPWRTIGKANLTLVAGDKVYIRTGSYNETIKPSRSGTQGNHITYQAYPGEEATLTGVSIGADLTERDYINIDGLQIVDVGSKFIVIYDGHHNIIQNCSMDNFDGHGKWGAVYLSWNSSYNKILNNKIWRGRGDVVYLTNGAHHNLVEGNDINGALGDHASISLRGFIRDGVTMWVHHNIIRRNNVHHGDHDNFTMTEYVKRNVFEENVVSRSGGGLKFAGVYDNIIRRNISYLNSVFGFNFWNGERKGVEREVVGNKVYHNVSSDNGSAGKWNSSGLVLTSYSALSFSGNRFVNNIIADNSRIQIYVSGRGSFAKYRDNLFAHNLLIGPRPVDVLNNAYSASESNQKSFAVAEFDGNLEGDPKFADAANGDFMISDGSLAIDAGRFLSLTVGEGSGTQMRVQDAGYFIDGFGIVEGDLIQLEGQTEVVRIVNVDYDSNVLTLARSLSWKAGQGVSLTYSGTAPDIGAFEFSSESDTIPPRAPSNVEVKISE